MGPTGRHRVLQLHPTRRCNLRCLHCYSYSSPEERETLDPSLLAGVIKDAASLGYTVVGFSGGEPLMYSGLLKLLDNAHEANLITTVTTNGMLLSQRRLESLVGRLDLLAISLDGIPSSHNRMRGSPLAFRSMADRLNHVRESGIPFGFIFTLTQHNLHELEWVATFASDQGANLLQIHPLEAVGRAAQTLPGSLPDERETAIAYLEFVRIQERLGQRIHIHLDLADRDVISLNPERVFANEMTEQEQLSQLAELISPLVVEADGTVVPLQYGFDRRFALGNVQINSLVELSRNWVIERYSYFRTLCQKVFQDLADDLHTLPFLNWYAIVADEAAALDVSEAPSPLMSRI